MELRIDNQPCDIEQGCSIRWGWNCKSLRTVGAQRAGWELRLDLPITPTNSALFCHADQPHMAERFNRSRHKAEVRIDGLPLFRGVIHLVKSRSDQTQPTYSIRIRGGTADWAHEAALASPEELEIPFSMKLTPYEIAQSWSNESPVRLLPVLYDDYQTQYDDSSYLSIERPLPFDHYHPFLHAATLVRRIVEQRGYSLQSRFIEGEFFQKIYISGAYPQRNTEATRRKYDFLARRTGDVSAVADGSGRVDTTPTTGYSAIGNIVNAITPGTLDDQGNVMSDCFSTNQALTFEEEELIYRPQSEIQAGFEYHLRYTTDYYIATRTRLQGFDSIYLGPDTNYSGQLSNRFKDHRSKPIAGQNYRLIIFDYNKNYYYRLHRGDGGVIATIYARSASVTMPESGVIAPLSLMVFKEGKWQTYQDDWALYDGYITETGSTQVEVTLRSSPENIGPKNPKKFSQIYFYGAKPEMKFTLEKESYIRPYFSAQPGYGALITWRNVSALGVSQEVLLDALGELFNWRIFTDEERKVVSIEPESDFYQLEQPIDWRDRIIEDEPLWIEESDLEVHGLRRYGYRTGDGAVTRFNKQHDDLFGEWSVHFDSTATLTGVERKINPLFSATLNEEGHLEQAMNASVPMVGDRDDLESVDNHRFTPRIVGYLGLKSLPDGQRWGYPAPEGVYPLAAFHYRDDTLEESFSLCFEDRDDVVGIHRFHDHEIGYQNLGRRLVATLLLTAEEIEMLLHRADRGQAGIDSIFRLEIDHEPIRGFLEAIESYDPSTMRARCRFTLLPDDRP